MTNSSPPPPPNAVPPRPSAAPPPAASPPISPPQTEPPPRPPQQTPPPTTAQAYGSAPVPPPQQPPAPPHAAGQNNPFAALGLAATWGTALIPAGIALAGGLVTAVLLILIMAVSGGTEDLTREVGLGSADMTGASFAVVIPFILVALALGGSGVVRFGAGYGESGSFDAAAHLTGAPLVISIVMLGLLWWTTKRSEVRHPSPNVTATWLRIGIGTLALTLLHFLLQLVFAARTTEEVWGGTLSIELSAVTVRTFFLPLLVILVASIWGRAAGHFMGTRAIGASFLRWIVPSGYVVLVHLALSIGIMSIVGLLVGLFAKDIPWQVVPLLFVNLGAALTSLVHGGGVTMHAAGAFESFMDSTSTTITLFSSDTPGLLWLGVLVTVVAVLAASLVATTTRRPSWTTQGNDPHRWLMMWQGPIAFAVVWGLMSLLVLPLGASLSGSGELAELMGGSGSAHAGIGAAPWTFLVFLLWGGVVEVVSRTIGPRLVMTLPGVAKFLTGRAIHPYWGHTLQMPEPRGALVHPDVARDMAMQAPAVSQQAGASQPYGTPQQPGDPQQGPPPGGGGGAAPPGGYAPQAPAQPFDRRRATFIAGIAGALVVVIVGGILVVTQINSRAFGPEGVAQKYFSALADGDAQGALELADVDVPAEQRTLLTNEVLGAAQALPADVSVDGSTVDSDSATVDVSYDLGGSKESLTLSLQKAGRTALFFDDWRLQSPQVSHLTVVAPGLDSVRVNGVEVPTAEGAVDLPAFPALYTVGLAEESDFVSADDVQARVFFGGADDLSGDSATLQASASDTFQSAVEEQVRAHIDECAASSELEPADCPFSASGLWYIDDAQGVSWSIDAYPMVSVQTPEEYGYYGDPADAAAWYVVTSTPGDATVTGTHEDFSGDREEFEEDQTLTVGGTASIVDGEVVFEPHSDDGGW